MSPGKHGADARSAKKATTKPPKGSLRFRDRNPKPLAIWGVVGSVVLMAVSLTYDRIPYISGTHNAHAYVADAAGLNEGDEVHVAGMKVGEIRGIEIDGDKVRVDFSIDTDVQLGEDTSAQIKTDSLLGRRALAVFSAGRGELADDTIPIDRTSTPYALTSALGDLSDTVSELDTDKVDQALTTLSETLQKSSPEVKGALNGVTRLSKSLNKRDKALRELLHKASDASSVLGERSQQFSQLVRDGNTLFAELDSRKRSIDSLVTNVDQLAQQLSGLVQDNEAQLGPALDKLEKVSDLLIKDKDRIDLGLRRIAPFASALGEAVSSGPWFNAYISNLAQPQYWQAGVHELLPLLNSEVPNQGPLVTDPELKPSPNPEITTTFPGWGKEAHK